ncbi:hypothetical protein C8F04DRAFT_1182936 [Mycena alexandri]|uniref:SRPBCC domain-containing protein n=1 Tax=Mycena alexandri TaxID=1745969 RepID=A0AAD6X760_9AGAR|nr:hypothetical protein C8F04DRAFT_1182936 [Mycena alexandri]
MDIFDTAPAEGSIRFEHYSYSARSQLRNAPGFSMVINAPRKKVWDTLVDFSEYAKWNPYIRTATLLDGSKKHLPGSNPQLAKGNYVGINVHMPPSLDHSIKTQTLAEFIMHVKPQRQLAWGSSKTKFEIIAVFSGLGPGLAKEWMRTTVTACIEEMAGALKSRCE